MTEMADPTKPHILSSSIPNKNKIQMCCMKSVLVSVPIALINGLNKNKLGEEGFILVHKSKSKYITRGSTSGISLRASQTNLSGKSLENECFHASTQSSLSTLALQIQNAGNGATHS